ncbi:MAG: dTDP-4-dehydrorhamnose 3,5-epimerase, partial [Pseudomonadota bacterium]
VLAIQAKPYADQRGYFVELSRQNVLADAGITAQFVQNNRSSSKAGVLRGLHFQWPNPQGKLVRVDFGSVFDVAVDIRPESPQFGQWHGEILSDQNHRQLWIPEGFAHGFLTLSEQAVVGYLCSDYYVGENDRAIVWNDPDIGIDWPLESGIAPIISEKDAGAQSLAQWRAAAA